MRSKKEIEKAHDILRAHVTGEVPTLFRPEVLQSMCIALDALCWVLGHEHNQKFQENLDHINEETARLGYLLRQVD